MKSGAEVASTDLIDQAIASGTLGEVKPEWILFMMLFAGATPAEEVHVGAARIQRSPADSQAAVEALARIATKFGAPLLAAHTTEELDERLAETERSESFLTAVVELVSTVQSLRPQIALDAVSMDIEAALHKLPPELRSMVRQGMAVNLEVGRRTPNIAALPPQVVDDALKAFRQALATDPQIRPMLTFAACGFAVARLFDEAFTADPRVSAEVVRRWFEAARSILRLIDPVQAAIDRATHDFPVLTREALLRLGYRWEQEPELGHRPTLVVLIVLRDAAPEDAYYVTETELRTPLERNLSSAGVDADVSVRLGLASDPA